jgi:hypothetical protein
MEGDHVVQMVDVAAPSLVPSLARSVDVTPDTSPQLLRQDHRPPPAWSGRARVGAALGVAAVGLLAATGYFAWQVTKASDQVSRISATGMQWDQQAMSIENGGLRNQRLEVVSAAGALVTGGMAAWLLLRK